VAWRDRRVIIDSAIVDCFMSSDDAAVTRSVTGGAAHTPSARPGRAQAGHTETNLGVPA
jgi:hypothetical protein